jgi:hypothetical protein
VTITATDHREEHLRRRLWELGKGDAFGGVVQPGERPQRIRATIIAGEAGHIVLGTKADGNPITFAEAFAATYGEPL